MLKHLISGVVVASVIIEIVTSGVLKAQTSTSTGWIESPVSVTKQADVPSLPASMGNNGNIDCFTEDATTCSVPTVYGAASQNSAVRLNSSSKYLPITSYVDNRQHFLPVPNSNMAISYFSGPPYGLYLAFNYNFSSSITKSASGYQIDKPPDAKLTDITRHPLATDTASMSFSENGQWMVVSDPNVAMLRVNLQTFEVVPFAPGFNYTIGLDPSVKTAVTNDGHYAMVASLAFNTFKVYDLNTCGPVPGAINASVSCQSKDLSSIIREQIPDYSFVAGARFINNDSLSTYAVYKSGSVNKIAKFTITDTGTNSQIDYLAIGDSYISGEGAFDYAGGTDTADNHCHLSYLSYPFLLGLELNYNSYHSVACSGATTYDITDGSYFYIGQADQKDKTTRAVLDKANLTSTYISSFTPGYLNQMEFVKTYQPRAITVSIFGNNIGMISKLKECIKPDTCFSTYEDRLEFVNDVNNKSSVLTDAYTKIRNTAPPDARVYAIGYPQIAKAGGDCALNVHLNNDEVIFTNQAIDYLDSVIKVAAAKAGVLYVDTQDAFDGHRLCEAGPGSVAMNGVTAGNDIPNRLGGPIGNESFHPNTFGYQLLENKILTATHNLSDPMPTANPNASLPPEDNLDILNAAHSNRQLNTTEFDSNISADLVYQQVPADISVNGASHSLAPDTPLRAELHSTPVALGNFITDTQGNLSAQVTVPSDIPPGFHSLHFYGSDINGQPVDIYKDLYVAATADDLDGNGVADSAQQCVVVKPAGQDFDQDGVDDACDGDISLPPDSTSNPVSVLGSASSKTPGLTASTTNSSLPSSVKPVVIRLRVEPNSTHVLGASTTKAKPAAGPNRANLRIQPKYFVFGLSLIMLIGLVASLL